MNNKLPLKIKPLKLIDQVEVVNGVLPLSDCPRLSPLLSDSSGAITVQLHFGRASDGRACITGTVNSTLRLPCERCGEPVSCDINVGLKLGPVMSDEQAAKLPQDYEPLLLVDDSPISLIELVEEEVLLGLPMFAKHELDECPVKTFNEV